MKYKSFTVTKDTFNKMLKNIKMGGLVIKEKLNYPVPDGYHIAFFMVEILQDNGETVTIMIKRLRIMKDKPLPPSGLV